MAVGTLLGGLLQLVVQLPSLRAVGFRYRPILDLRHPGVRQVVRLMAPATIGAAAVQVNVFVNSNFASYLGDGDTFEEAIADCAAAYATVTEADHTALTSVPSPLARSRHRRASE